jgi:peptide/nickel transport system permease protein
MDRTKIAQLPNDEEGKLRFGESLFQRAIRRLKRDPLTLTAMFVFLLLALSAMFAPQICAILGIDPYDTIADDRLLLPGSPGHILGTDDLGRDYLARLLYGGRVSLTIGFVAAIATLTIGLVLGMFTGYFGGKFDDFTNWVVITLDSIPTLYLLILISSLLNPSAEALILVFAAVGWTGGTRLIRGQTIALRDLDYILAARAMGASVPRVIFMHILPNLISITVISLATAIGGVMIAEATLSFLRVGIQPPTPTWGNMLSNARQFFTRGPHMATISGVLIFITVLCLYVMGDGLRDAFDPRLTD